MKVHPIQYQRAIKNLEALFAIGAESVRLNTMKGIMPDSVKEYYDPQKKLDKIETDLFIENLANEIGEDTLVRRMNNILQEEVPEMKIYDRKGQEISFLQKCDYDQDEKYRVLGNHSFANFRVMTVWNGLNHGINVGKFLIFSTAVISDERYMLYEFHHSTEDEALSRHQYVFNLVKRSLKKGRLDHGALEKLQIKLEGTKNRETKQGGKKIKEKKNESVRNNFCER